MNLHPIADCLKKADEAVLAKGGFVLQQFLCEECGAKQTMDEPNNFYTHGTCEECGHTTDLRETGCNFAAIFSVGGIPK